MDMSYPKSLAIFLKDSNGLQALLAHAQRLQRVTKMLHAQLGQPLNQHCEVANIKDSMLVLHASSSAWASKLRFQAATMLKCLHKEREFAAVRAIRVKVSPVDLSRPSLPHRLCLSEQAAAVLHSTAQATSDPGLKAVLLRLAGRQQKGC